MVAGLLPGQYTRQLHVPILHVWGHCSVLPVTIVDVALTPFKEDVHLVYGWLVRQGYAVHVRALNEVEHWGPSDHCRLEIFVPMSAADKAEV